MTVPGTADDLRREIAAAFAARELPERVALSRPDCPRYEGDEAREWLAGRSWRQVADGGVSIEHRDYLAFLTLDGWLYYFPGFASLALDPEHPAELDETLVFRLWSYPEEISAALAPRERRAIVHFLEHLADRFEQRGDLRNTAAQALDEHWAYFTDDELGLGEGPAPNALQENGDVPS
jgi:hypothetical protein